MIYPSRRIDFPATPYRPTGLVVAMENTNMLHSKDNVVQFPNYSTDTRITPSPKEIFINPFGTYEVKNAVVVELTDAGDVIEHTVGLSDSTGGSDIVGETYELESMTGSFVAVGRFLCLSLLVLRPMKILGVYLVLANDAHAWANAIVKSSRLNLISYYGGKVKEEKHYWLSTGDIRLGVKADFVDCFKRVKALALDTSLSAEQVEVEKEKILEGAEGDIIYFTEKDQYVIFSFGIPYTSSASSLCVYSLDDFCAAITDPLAIDTNYWLGDKSVTYSDGFTHIPARFWEGRNALLRYLGMPQSVVLISDFLVHLYKFIKDSRYGKVFVPELLDTWEAFSSSGGVTCLGDLYSASVFMSYKLKLPVLFFPSCSNAIEGDKLDIFLRYVSRCHLFTLEWIDFNDVDSDPAVGGFVVDYPYDSNFTAFLNIEESAFDITDIPSSLCSAFRPFGWRQINFPDPFNCIKPEDDTPALEPMYEGYELPEVVGVDDMSSFNMTEIIIHEIGHAVDAYGINLHNNYLSNMPEWLEITGWEPGAPYQSERAVIQKDGYSNELPGGREAPVSSYACTHRKEDFAETYRTYIINPMFLKDNFPLRYAFMERFVRTMKPVEGAVNCAFRDTCAKWKPWVCR